MVYCSPLRPQGKPKIGLCVTVCSTDVLLCCRVNCVRFPLYLLMVIDGHGRGQVVGFAYVRYETQHYINRIFDAFVYSNVEACDKIKVVLTDKDFVEQQVIKTALSHVSLQLCLFHVLRAFNRGISEYNLSSDQRDRVCSIFEQLVYTDTPSEFDDLLRQLQAFPAAFAYYSRCWDVCKDQWAQCNTRHRVTFGVRTNNYVESQNQKIKFVLSQKVPFCESIHKLLKLFELQYHEHQQRNSEAVCKKTYIHNSKLPEEFCSKLTVYALKEVNRQLAKASLWLDSNALHILRLLVYICCEENLYKLRF